MDHSLFQLRLSRLANALGAKSRSELAEKLGVVPEALNPVFLANSALLAYIEEAALRFDLSADSILLAPSPGRQPRDETAFASAELRVAERHSPYNGSNTFKRILLEADNMSPTLLPGDILLIDPFEVEPVAFEGIYAMTIDGDSVVRRLSTTHEGLACTNDNPHYPDSRLQFPLPTGCFLEGRVVRFLRDLEEPPPCTLPDKGS